MSVDWSKPIQFKNGERCELKSTKPEGWALEKAREDGQKPTRRIQRLDATPPFKVFGHAYEDGTTDWPEDHGYTVINEPEQ